MRSILPPTWTLTELLAADLGSAAAWVSPSLVERAKDVLPWPHIRGIEGELDRLNTLIVLGGGTMIDEGKAAVRDAGSPCQLIVIPAIWGSGAEASPVVVLNRDGKKQIRLDPKYLPDRCVYWPDLAATVPPARARQACGDCWAHALEGFLSPMADDALRGELSELLHEMLATPLGNDSRWFELSARACAGQAQSGVGLVHGIAHVLEHDIKAANPHEEWHHARLCATMLFPVMQFNRATSEKWDCLAKTWPLDADSIFAVLRQLFEPAAYEKILPLMSANWMQVLRDPCSRMNSALVRPQSIEYFREWSPGTSPQLLAEALRGNKT